MLIDTFAEKKYRQKLTDVEVLWIIKKLAIVLPCVTLFWRSVGPEKKWA